MQDFTELALKDIQSTNRDEFSAWIAELLGADIKPRFGSATNSIFFEYSAISKYSDGFRKGDEVALTYVSDSAGKISIERASVVNRSLKY